MGRKKKMIPEQQKIPSAVSVSSKVEGGVPFGDGVTVHHTKDTFNSSPFVDMRDKPFDPYSITPEVIAKNEAIRQEAIKNQKPFLTDMREQAPIKIIQTY